MPPNPTIFQIPSRASKAAVLKVIDPAEQSSPNEEPSHVQAKDVIYGTSTLQNLLAPSSVPTDTERALAQEPRHGNNLSSWTPDVYAHRYVPLSFLEINRAPSIHVITTPGVHGVDFYSYISTFAGSDFLSPQPLHGEGINQLVTSSPGEDCLELPDGERNDKLTPKNYRVYFSDRLIRELEAQQLEFQTYNLYGVPLGVRDHAQNIFSLRVPGIRESTPPVNFGDIIMMRQVLIDLNTGLPRGMDLWLATDFTQRYETCPGFTGYQLRPVVVGIDRANEVLDLRIHGLVLSQRLVCNVTFIAQPRFLQSLERAVEDAASEIQQVEALTPLNRSPESPAFESNRIFKDHTLKVLSPLESGAVSRLAKDSLSVGRERQDLPIIGTISESNSRTTSSVKWLHAMLFPGEGNGTLQFTHPSVSFPQTWFDRSLNYEQKKAVDAVQSRNYGQFCFLIHGPPGTGKTKTICEIVTQLGKDSQISGSILVCAPSNPAADTLAMRLRAHFGPKDLLRLNDFSRTFAEVPQELLPFCYVENDIFNLPPFATLMAYKIVVTTCRDASILIQARVTNRDLIALQLNLANAIAPSLSADNTTGKPTPLHWAALIVDEAAQATEPETLIPVLVVSPHSKYPTTFGPIFVMTGDEHQLNPRTYAISTNLQISLFQRLSSVSVYASHPLARNQSARKTYKLPMLRPAFVNLIKNYRSHPAILAVPSSLFYNNTLIPEAIHVESLQSWTGWRGRCWPVLFACNSGIDECQDILTLGGGWYNVQEAKKAIGYARDLFTTGLITEQSEICIMSPFRAQVNVLRKMARESRMWGLNIGPVDAFQGLESRFVIICTTRARKRFLDDDKSRRIGIIHERKKFNVAITRAKEGLIVIGNPWILETDECWMAFMKFCWRNSLWQVEDEAETHEDGNVNAWEPTTGSDNGEDSDTAQIAGLEAALVYKERDQWTGSQGAKRFMGEIQSQDDALWRSGLEAEAAIEEAGPA